MRDNLYRVQRERMVQEQLVARGIEDPRVLEAMREVPRHLFVDEALQDRAYADGPLPIGEGQTISQPYIVALSVQALELRGDETVLDVGAGSGYQTAILARLAERVFAIERKNSLLQKARRRFEELRLMNIVSKAGDGSRGWREEAPFEAIVVAAAAPLTPTPLLGQLADGGIMVAPVGPEGAQRLMRIERDGEEYREEQLCRCAFVPLVGQHGQESKPGEDNR